MVNLDGNARSEYVQGMFARIAPHYDLMNQLMTFGQDRSWRRIVLQKAEVLSNQNLILDLGAGTGDLGLQAYQRNAENISIEADFTLEMMRAGLERPGARALCWSAADALRLPFPDNTFDAVVSGFLLRNVVDLDQALSEQFRVLKIGGRIVSLDTTRPQKNCLTPFVRFYMLTIIPLLGQLISGQKDAYLYLPVSSEGFLTAEELAAQMITAGFVGIGFKRLNLGTIAIHWGEK
jgi:demethylmenaquinone methyltransferase/2-methoxy-6-polyprenyl-1,4-benzoquinol methylase